MVMARRHRRFVTTVPFLAVMALLAAGHGGQAAVVVVGSATPQVLLPTLAPQASLKPAVKTTAFQSFYCTYR
jgi:hypothetical protein